jgi:flagellar FliL protein
MSNENGEQEVSEAPEANGKKGRMALVLALTLGIAVGGVAGSIVVGPLVAEGAEETAAATECECQEDGEHEGGEGEGEHGAGAASAKPVHVVENLVVNPAQSGGTRYLISTIAFSVKDSTVVEKMGQRDAEVRDALLKVLGAKSVVQLSDMTHRPALKEEVRTAVGGLFGNKAVKDVFFPQFVIQ